MAGRDNRSFSYRSPQESSVCDLRRPSYAPRYENRSIIGRLRYTSSGKEGLGTRLATNRFTLIIGPAWMREARTVLADLSTTRPGLETVSMYYVNTPTAHLFPSGRITVRSYRPLWASRGRLFLLQRIRRRCFAEEGPDRAHARPKPCPEGGQDEDNATQEDCQDDHDKVHRSASLDSVEGTSRMRSYL